MSNTFWQAQATVMLTPRMPLYIPCPSQFCGTPGCNEKRCVAQLRPGCSLPPSAPRSHDRTGPAALITARLRRCDRRACASPYHPTRGAARIPSRPPIPGRHRARPPTRRSSIDCADRRMRAEAATSTAKPCSPRRTTGASRRGRWRRQFPARMTLRLGNRLED